MPHLHGVWESKYWSLKSWGEGKGEQGKKIAYIATYVFFRSARFIILIQDLKMIRMKIAVPAIYTIARVSCGWSFSCVFAF